MCLVSFSKTPRYASLEKLETFHGKPRWAYVVITERCSHSCPWCYGAFGRQNRGEMRLADFERLLGTLEAMGIGQLTISGGEPTEHPRFLDFLDRAGSFHVHLASHGDRIDEGLASRIAEAGVRQVQINFQGSSDHRQIHGVDTYVTQTEAMKALLRHGVEVVAMTTVGRYNLDRIGEIFAEAAALGVTRLRVWETSGRGRRYLEGLSAKAVFETCAAEAERLGYVHSLSYDPEYEGDVTVPCLQLSNLYMYIDTSCRVRFCGAVEEGPIIADALHDTPDEIMTRYLETNRRMLAEGKPWCLARSLAPVESRLTCGP